MSTADAISSRTGHTTRGHEDDYTAFIRSKRITAQAVGFDVDEHALPAQLFDWQRAIVRWALHRGRAAIWAECGLGKTPMQLEWARQVHQHTDGDVLILAPLAVTSQTAREGAKFGIPVTVCRSQAQVRPGINVANYEMLEHFDPGQFVGVVLDESSILKAFMGATKRLLIETFSATPYRLCCTATPAPNDHMEIGNHVEFLGIMPSYEMLTRWFINDTTAMGTYRLKGHAERDFWDWVATWAVALRSPSDLGYSDDGFELPEMQMRHEVVEVDRTLDAGDALFRDPAMSATTLHKEMRLTAADRADRVKELVSAQPGETWAIWVNTNYEADAVMKRLPGAVEVRGSESIAAKERKLTAFTQGDIRVLVTKPTVAGYGLNWQHCARTAFVGLSYSFEQFYQAVRRFHRFGQTRNVECYVVAAETEGPILATIQRKIAAHERMLEAMTASTSRLALQDGLQLTPYEPAVPMHLPAWLFTHTSIDEGVSA